MDARQERGIELAKTRTIRKKSPNVWIVPSQAGNGAYRVCIRGEYFVCNCPDFETRQQSCKHVYAVAYTMIHEKNPDGSTTVTETVTVTATRERKTYPQQWPAYNRAQTNEKEKFQSLLFDLCRCVQEPQVKRAGRPNLPLADAIFSATYKVYSTVSARRFMSDLREAHTRGFISRVPHYNSIFNYLENETLTPMLRSLIMQSALPLRSVEVDFAADSSGFTTSRFHRWFDHKYGKVIEEHDWVKCHLMCGVKTNIVTAVEIHDRNASDSKLLPPLVNATAEHFKVEEVSADKGYMSAANSNLVGSIGAIPYIAFQSKVKGHGGGMWSQMFGYFMYRREEFLQHYHKRSNVESTFSMIKRKFGDSLRSKTDVAMVNETLCKILCHNLVVLIHEMYELGIEPVFWAASTKKPVTSVGQ